MTDPERLSKDTGNSLAALLLQAGARERPSAAVLSRTTRAIAITATAVAAAAVVKSAGSASAASVGTPSSAGATLGVAAVAKWLAIGALGGAVAMSSLQALTVEHGPQSKRATPAASTNAAVSKSEKRSTKAAPGVSEPIASAEPSLPDRATLVEAPKARSAEPVTIEPTKPAVPERAESALLAAEVHLVEQGRAAVQRAAFAEAIAQLEPYERLFPRRQLLTEVLFLRMESFNRLGNVERARALATQLLTLGVVGRQAAQAREVLGP
ncbi:MAG TPA: hypothetical protein VER11_23365 [Polyangiaceae bacterium]|nr:hypothetical protein [Polyangiaceae bacterium]